MSTGARQVAQQAEAVARSITDPYMQARALAEVAQALARAGDVDRAEAVARSIADPSRQARALAVWRGRWPGRVMSTGRVGSLSRPRPSPGRSPTRPSRHGRWRVWRRHWPGRVMLDRAEAVGRFITDLSVRVTALAGVAGALAESGDVDRPRRVAQQAEAVARSITDLSRQAKALRRCGGGAGGDR